MTKSTNQLLSGVAVAAGVLLTAAYAKSYTRIVVDVPFAFVAANEILPPGAYALVNDGTPGILKISGASAVAIAVQPERHARAGDRSELTFHRYGNEYFLEQVRIAGQEYGAQVSQPDAEHRLAEGGIQPRVTAVRARAR